MLPVFSDRGISCTSFRFHKDTYRSDRPSRVIRGLAAYPGIQCRCMQRDGRHTSLLLAYFSGLVIVTEFGPCLFDGSQCARTP